MKLRRIEPGTWVFKVVTTSYCKQEKNMKLFI